MNLKSKKMICLLVAIASVLTIVGSVSYAYFTAMGEVTPMDATLNTATVSVNFSDNDLGLNAELNFGESVTKKFTIENTGTADAKIKMFFDKMTNTYTEGSLTYTLSYSETEDGTYIEVVDKTNVPQSEITSKKILANSLTIPVGKTYYYELVITLNYLSDVNQDDDVNAIFNTKFKVEDINSRNIVGEIIATSQGVKTSFDDPATTDEGIFEMEDDYGTSYYYRGAVENNYVKFAGFYWRIIRINGNGSIRLIYDGTSARANGSMLNVDSGVFNTSQSGNAYIGFKYDEGSPHGLGQKSNILKILENWYVTNLTNYESKLDINSSFCGDRNSNTIEGEMPNETVGAGTDKTYYGAKYRLNTQKNPSLKCSNINDLYTISKASKGNKSLTYPIGLITADEVAMAGGLWGTANSNYYLYIGTGQYYWTLSPYTSNSNYANLFLVSSSGSLTAGGQATVSRSYGIRQVINLKSNTVFTGTGTMNDPYVVI